MQGRDVPKPVMDFEEPNFPEPIYKAVVAQGFPSPTPIQAQGWPMALQGRDFVGIAHTGSGKTIGVRVCVNVCVCVCVCIYMCACLC